ncbi:MAG: GNAT family N-acetyltransferase [Anaerolineaceae bacterium]
MEPEPEAAAPGGRKHRRPAGPMITSEDFATLRPAWEALHAAVPGATPFTHPAWHETWLQHFGARSVPVFLSFRVDQQLVGVAALDMAKGEARSLGDPNVRDYAGPLVAPGHEEMAAAGLLEWLTEDLTRRVELWGLRGDGSFVGALMAVAGPMGWQAERIAEAVSPQMALPADFETYLAGLSKNARHEIRRKLRNLAAAGTVSFESATDPAAVSAQIPAFLELMRVSRDDKDEFLAPAMEAFFRGVTETFASLGLLRLSSLKLDGVTIAMTLAFESAETAFLYNSGYDPAFAALAAGLLSKVHAIRDSIARGKRTFDFLRGDEPYKAELGGQPLQIVTLTLRQR